MIGPAIWRDATDQLCNTLHLWGAGTVSRSVLTPSYVGELIKWRESYIGARIDSRPIQLSPVEYRPARRRWRWYFRPGMKNVAAETMPNRVRLRSGMPSST